MQQNIQSKKWELSINIFSDFDKGKNIVSKEDISYEKQCMLLAQCVTMLPSTQASESVCILEMVKCLQSVNVPDGQ